MEEHRRRQFERTRNCPKIVRRDIVASTRYQLHNDPRIPITAQEKMFRSASGPSRPALFCATRTTLSPPRLHSLASFMCTLAH